MNITIPRAALAQPAPEPVQNVLLSAAGLALDALEHDRQAAARAGRSISMLSLRAIEELRGALRAALAQPDTCTWWQDGDSDSGTYQTSCGHYFAITDGTPEDNKMRHCCYCGKTLAQELITEDEDE